MSESPTSLTSLREEDGSCNASGIICDNGNELEWISGYCSTKPHSTISIDTEISEWIQVGEQLLNLVSRVNFLRTAEDPKEYTLAEAVRAYPIHPLFAYYSGVIAAIAAVRERLENVLKHASTTEGGRTSMNATILRLQAVERSSTSILSLWSDQTRHDGHAARSASDALGFLIPEGESRYEKRSTLNITRYFPETGLQGKTDSATEKRFWEAQGTGWTVLNELLKSAFALGATHEGSKLERAIRQMALLGYAHAIDLRDDLEESLSYDSGNGALECRQETFPLRRTLESIYGELTKEVKTRVEQQSISPFPDGADGIAASVYSFRMVDDDKKETRDYFGCGDEGVGM